ncbi:MAG: hypothetical protein E7461_01445 [Ruminococcaceae bacterium]|nr:hypothetical protein [Oscillospiraceae bacterium]
MLRVILGTDWVANREEILRQLSDDVKNERENRILMVPELISHDMERRLCEAAGDTASRYAEVLSFTRLTQRVSDYMNIAPEECLDSGGRVVAMAAVAGQLRGSLKAYAAVETKPEFLTGLVDAVDEFKRCCITPEDLQKASERCEGVFAQKLSELALLYNAYDGITAHGKRDPRDQMTWLLEKLEEGDFAQNHVFYIDGFPDFTRQHMAILSHLICESPLVVIGINCDVPASDHMAFQKAGETAKTILNAANSAGVKTEIKTISPGDSPVAKILSQLYQGRIEAIDRAHIVALRTESPYKEVTLAAKKIRDLLYNGVRYRDISLVCSNTSAYKAAISAVFRRCGIPYYLTGKECVLERPVVHTVLYALEAVLSGFEQSDVLRYFRSAMSPMTLAQCDKLENYVLLWSIGGNGWCDTWKQHPGGLLREWTEKAEAELAHLEELRQKGMEPLVNLRDGLRAAVKLSEQVEALYAFLEEISFAGRLRAAAVRYDRDGDNRSAQVLDQLWTILLNALEQMHDVLGQSVWDTQSFYRLLRLLLSQYDVGTIPSVLDAVTVGDPSAMRCQQGEHLIVLGMIEGEMPGYSGSAGVLTDWERTALREMGVPLTGGALEGLQAELAEIYGVFCGARSSVTAVCPGGMPSFVYRRLADMAGGEQTWNDVVAISGIDKGETAAYLVESGEEAAANSLGLGEVYRNIADGVSFCHGTVDFENTRGLYGDMLELSASQVDKFADCRMRYFLQYGLRARERKPAAVDPAEYGTYVHAVLEDTVREVMEKGGFRTLSVHETLEIARKYSAEYVKSNFSGLESQRISYLLNRNSQELDMVVEELWDELQGCAFLPADFEVHFGTGGKMPPIEIAGSVMHARLNGFVDRVDVWQEDGRNYFRVVDYKTGKKDFDYCDVYNGIGLQMLLYLFALAREGEEILGERPYPAGVQYFPARAPLVSSDGALSDEEAKKLRIKEWKRKGLLLCDKDVLNAMQPEGSPQRLDYRVNKDGEISGAVASRDQFRLLEAYITKFLCQMVDTIASGNVEANPYTRGNSHNACSYCPYKQICNPEQVEGRREYAAMKAEGFWERIERSVNADG